MAKKNRRFAVVYTQSGMTQGAQILVDRKTGVHYLFYKCGYGGGLTPLLDREGRPVVSAAPAQKPEPAPAAPEEAEEAEETEEDPV